MGPNPAIVNGEQVQHRDVVLFSLGEHKRPWLRDNPGELALGIHSRVAFKRTRDQTLTSYQKRENKRRT